MLRNKTTRPETYNYASSEYTTSPEDTLCSYGRRLHSHQWDKDAGSLLSEMMRLAGYSDESQATHRHFFASRAAPSLGPHPDLVSRYDKGQNQWKSFMTDDHTPVELSWSWGAGDTTPAVRYAIEPIGWLAGTRQDPLNHREAAACLANTLPWALSLDFQWYRYFFKALTTHDADDITTAAKKNSPPSQSFIGFDLERDSMVVKYYFIPSLKAASLGQSRLDLVEKSILAMPGASGLFAPSLAVLTGYIRSFGDAASQLKVEIFAVDCVRPEDSRMKIYVRSADVTFRGLLQTMTLGGRLPELRGKMKGDLTELWHACFGHLSSEKDLQSPLSSAKAHHRTGGLLYYFELRPGAALPTAKAYLPVRHYAQSDEQVAMGLSGFLEKRGKRLAGGASYYEGVTSLW